MPIETYFHHLWGDPHIDAFAAAAARYGLIACIGALAIAWLVHRPRGALTYGAAGAAVAFVLVWLAGLAYHEPRPFVVLGTAPLVPHGSDNAFPSDHSAAAAYASTFACFIDRRLGAIAWAGAIVLGLARMYCLLHTPVDVAGGWVLGGLPAALAAVWWRRRRAAQV